MKHISILILAIFITSCGGSKNVIDNNTTQQENTQQIETTETEVVESIEVKTNEVEIIDETNSMDSVKEMMEEQKEKTADSLKFNQELSKREGYIHDLFDELLEKHVSSKGNVDYNGFKSSHKELLGYISVLQKINPKLDSLKPLREEQLAYWINAYNALTIDLILRNQPLNSIKDIDKPWDQRLWKFGDKWLNLNDIEHQILRKMNEPRIHFAIVCASFSCPKLQNVAFTASNLEEQLTNATKEFLSDQTKNEISENSLKLSKIFKWFAKDFKTNGTLIDFLNQYSNVIISDRAKKSYKNYSWDLND